MGVPAGDVQVCLGNCAGDLIDWFGIDWFNKDDFTGPLFDRRGLTAHGRSRKFLDMALVANRPVIIAAIVAFLRETLLPPQPERDSPAEDGPGK